MSPRPTSPGRATTTSTNGLTGATIIDETTPLIISEAGGPPAQSAADYAVKQIQDQEGHAAENPDEHDDRPLDKRQMAVLCYARMIEPIAFFSIIPFVNQMIHRVGDVTEAEVGFYSGLIESLFSVTQMLLFISWGWAADRFGRRPVLVVSILGTALGMTLFGFSTNLWQMTLCRCFAGAFAGFTVTVRAMFSENSTPKTQARAFSLFAVAGNFGIFLGPFIGGALSDPATQYPRLFGNSTFFQKYPYALATMTTGAFGVSAALVCFLFLNETLTKADRASETKPMSVRKLVKAPGVGIVLCIYSWNMSLGLAYTAVAPVFWYTSVSLGGFGFSYIQITVLMALGGICQALWMLFLFPPWQKRVGTGRVMAVLYPIYPFALGANVFISLILRAHYTKVFWVLAVLGTVVGSAMSMTFTAVQLALNDIAPSHLVLGMLNAVALTIHSGVRAIVPAMYASIFAWGVSKQILGGYLVWLVLALVASVLPISLRWLPAKAAGKGILKKTSPRESSDDP